MRRISELLKEERERKGYSLDDIEQATKIKKKYLTCIEQGAFYKLPSESYALGYVKNYASFLGISNHKVTPLFRREYLEEHDKEVLPHFRKKNELLGKRFLLSYKAVSIVGVILIVAGYIFFQYQSLLFGPELSLETPKNGQKVSKNVVEVKGKTTDPYATVLIEDEEVYVGLDGSFRKALYVFPGEKEIKIVAKNRFGKQAEKRVTVKVE